MLGIQGVKQQLRAAGHPSHQYTPADIVYELAHGLQHLEEAAVDLQQVLADWQDNIKAIHDKHNLSLFLSTHQLVAASDLLKALLSDGMYGKHCVACCLADVTYQVKCDSKQLCNCSTFGVHSLAAPLYALLTKHTQCNLKSDRPTTISATWDLLAHTAVSDEAGGQLHSLRQLLMLVPTLGDMSNATLKTAFESMQDDEQREAGRIGHLEAVGHLMQLLTSMKPPQVQG